jgi:2-polyprenyl-3-methyl-5-hydroxy-6-metoxy-1,4-benzoquinol methylase
MSSEYELSRVTQVDAFYRKLLLKRLLYRFVGELYVGRRVKLAYFRRWLPRFALAPTARIMEAGSGDGMFAFYVARRYPLASVVGLELNPVEAESCRRIAAREQLTHLSFRTGSLLDLDDRDHYDLIYCLDVLEHIQDDLAALRVLYGALVPGGSLLIHVPNRTYLETDGRLITVPDAEAWQINPGHVRQGYAPTELAAKLAQTCFRVCAIQQVHGRAIAYAFKLHAWVARLPPLRLLILPVVDWLTWLDLQQIPAHGNTVWAWAQKPLSHA